METVTARVESDTYEEIQQRTGDETSKSAVTRGLIERGLEAEEIETERDRLDNHLKQLLAEREEHHELVEYVDEEQTWREAPVWRRARWWLLGKN